MQWKRIAKAVLFPNIAFMIIPLPLATIFLVYSLLFTEIDSAIAIISYVLAFYTLLIWCLKLPYLIKQFMRFKSENKYARRWQNDIRFRVKVSLYGTLIWNTAYALLQLGMGIWHRTFWFCSLSAYYISLAVMRFFLARYTTKNRPGKRMRDELIRYRLCGWIFLVMNLALSLVVFFMIYWNRTFYHHEITTIAMATYTFTAFTVAIVNVVRYRKYNSPVYSASKAISMASACVSMLSLESTMLTTFNNGSMSTTEQKILLGCTGGAISVFIIVMSVYMILQSSKKLKALKLQKVQNEQ